MKYTKEELIAKAKEDYPIGCTYECANNGGVYTLKQDSSTYEYFHKGKEMIFAHGGAGCLYIRGIWAKIIKYPKNYKPVIKDIEYEIY